VVFVVLAMQLPWRAMKCPMLRTTIEALARTAANLPSLLRWEAALCWGLQVDAGTLDGFTVKVDKMGHRPFGKTCGASSKLPLTTERTRPLLRRSRWRVLAAPAHGVCCQSHYRRARPIMIDRRIFLWFLTLLACSTAVGLGQPRPSGGELVSMLRTGGLVIVIRHGATNEDQADTDPLNPDNFAKQRRLSAKGEDAAKAMGVAFGKIGFAMGKVVTSQFDRAYQTAKLAGLYQAERSADVTEGGLVVSPNENKRRALALRKLVSTVPASGTNTVIITHKPNILDAFGKDWFDVREGEATIFRPDGQRFDVVARLQIDEWAGLAAASN
jgi:phosphohistidine phosphatase SixA